MFEYLMLSEVCARKNLKPDAWTPSILEKFPFNITLNTMRICQNFISINEWMTLTNIWGLFYEILTDPNVLLLAGGTEETQLLKILI